MKPHKEWIAQLTIRCRFEAVTVDVIEKTDKYVLLRDTQEGRSVTNSADDIVIVLMKLDALPIGTRLFYYDSTGRLDEIVRDKKTGHFAGFAPCLERDLNKVCHGGVG